MSVNAAEKDFPGLYAGKSFQKSHSFDVRSDVSDESREESLKLKERFLRGKKDKKDRYDLLDDISSEEEKLVGSSSVSKAKERKKKIRPALFAKQKEKEKDSIAAASGKVGVAAKLPKEAKTGAATKLGGKHALKHHGNKTSSVAHKTGKENGKAAKGASGGVVFGVRLSDVVERQKDASLVPQVVQACIDYINANGLTSEGIYRLSASKKHIDDLKRAADSGEKLQFADAISAAALLKRYLRELPESILSDELLPTFEQAVSEIRSKDECIKRLKDLFSDMPLPCYVLTATIIMHLTNVIKNEKFNKMNLPNIGLTFQPTLRVSQTLLAFLLSNANQLFDDFKLRRQAVSADERVSYDLPTTASEIQAQLARLEPLLQSLHSQLSQGIHDEEKEKAIWDVQRQVTQLKRKLKLLAQVVGNQAGSLEVEPMKQTTIDGQAHSLSPGPCLEMFEEKQLLAVQMFLRDQIAKEARAIQDLSAALKEAKALTAASVSLPYSATPYKRETDLSSVNKDDSFSPDEHLSEEQWNQRAEQLQARKSDLIAKITEERYMCARLRAQLELATITQPSHEISEATRL